MLRAILLEDELHHVVFEVVREINVNVRQLVQRHAFLVQEAPKIEAEANRANAADSQAVTDQAVRRAATRDPLDAPALAVLEKIPGDEEIVLVTHLGDDAQLLLDLRPHLCKRHFRSGVGDDSLAGVTPSQAVEREMSQKVFRRGSLRSLERGELRFAKRKLEFASLSDVVRGANPFGMLRASRRHLSRTAEVVTSAASLLGMLVFQQRECADALENVVSAPIFGRGVVNRRTGDNGKTAHPALAHPSLSSREERVGREPERGATALSSRFAGGEGDKSFAGHLVKSAGEKVRQGHVRTHGKEPLTAVRQERPLQWPALLCSEGSVIFRHPFGVT